MFTILHGDDSVKLQSHLRLLVTQASEKHIPITRLLAKDLSLSDLEIALGTQELFASEKLIIIEGLHSLPKSKRKEELLEKIKFQIPNSNDQTHIICVENKTLTATQLKSFQTAKVMAFKLPVIVFQFIESIGIMGHMEAITRFHQVLEHQDAEFVFVMLIRQIRMLLAYIADGVYDGPPFGRSKIERQAKKFSLEQLLLLHKTLLDIDVRQKTSKTVLTLTQEIDLFLASL